MFVVLHQDMLQYNCSEISTTKSYVAWQTYVDEAEDRPFFVEVVNKSIHDAMLNHNEVFLNMFHNTMKEVFHGFPVDQVDRLITTFHIHRLKGLIKLVPAIKKQHQPVMMMSR